MFKNLAVTLAVALGSSPAAGGSAGAGGLFPLGVYWPHSYVADFAQHEGMETWAYVERVLDTLQTNHCTFIWATLAGDDAYKHLCELADQRGIRVAVLPEAVSHPMRTRQAATPAAAAQAAAEVFRTFGKAKNVWGYVLDDEPPLAALPYLEAIERELLRLDPGRPVTTVFRRTEAAPAIRRHDFGIVTYDCYPFGHERDPNLPNTPAASRQFYRHVTEALGRQCAQRGITFWVMPGAFQEIWGNWFWSKSMTVVAEPGAYLHWRMPTVGETRWQIWEALAGGAKGVVYYTLWPNRNFGRTSPDSPRDPEQEWYARRDDAGPKIDTVLDTGQPGALLNLDSTPTAQLAAMGETYREVAKLAPVLQRLSFANIPAVFATAPLRCQTFQDGTGALYAVVVNDDTDNPATAPLTLLPGIGAVRDLRWGAELQRDAGSENGLQRVTVELEAGGGTVLDLPAGVASRPLAKVVEDFSTPARAVTLERAEVRTVADAPWGVEWKQQVVRTERESGEPGAVTCPVVAGWSLAPSGPVFVVYQGRGDVEMGFSTDGKGFTPAPEQGFDRPIAVPRDSTHIRFVLKNGESTLDAFCTIATENTP